MSAIDEVFTALFFGSGSWLGLLLFIAIMLGLLMKNEYAGALILAPAVFLGVAYLNAGLGWHAITMFSTSVFIVAYMIQKHKN